MQAAPNAFEPRYLLGTAYNRLGRFQDALVQLQGAVRRNANEAEVYYHLARAYGGLGRQDERAQALARFAQLTKKGKEDAEGQRRAVSLIDEAKALVEQGNLRLALARMEEARELRPSDDRLLFRLASVYYDLRQYDLAQGYAQEALFAGAVRVALPLPLGSHRDANGQVAPGSRPPGDRGAPEPLSGGNPERVGRGRAARRGLARRGRRVSARCGTEARGAGIPAEPGGRAQTIERPQRRISLMGPPPSSTRRNVLPTNSCSIFL